MSVIEEIFRLYKETENTEDTENLLSQDEIVDLLVYFTKHNDQKNHVLLSLSKLTMDEEKIKFLKTFLKPKKPSSPDEMGSSTRKRKKREEDYKKTIQRGLEGKVPSIGAKPIRFFLNQKSTPILNGRPYECIGPPITLYNKVFGQFLENFRNENLDIPSEICWWVEDLIFAATDEYDDQESRNEKMREILSEHLGSILLIAYKKGKERCRCDGVSISNVGLLTAYMGMFVGRNEIGIGENDPTIQGALYYRDYWSQSCADQIRESCCAPSFIISIAGPWFCVLGAIFLSEVVVQPLTDFIPLTVNLRASDSVKRIIRLFQALSLAFRQLNDYYKNLDLSQKSDQRFFPYIRKVENFSFNYISELTDDRTRNIWKAQTDDNRMIVVKFVHKYNYHAHEVCKDYTPKLLYHDKIGEHIMVIMEYIDGIPLDVLHQRGFENIDCKVIYNDVRNAIRLLHENKYVFGDLRPPNVLVTKINGQHRAKLIDFDWCGVHEVDRYPPSMNKAVPWPDGAEPCALLRRDHDDCWLDYLKEYLNLSDNGDEDL